MWSITINLNIACQFKREKYRGRPVKLRTELTGVSTRRRLQVRGRASGGSLVVGWNSGSNVNSPISVSF